MITFLIVCVILGVIFLALAPFIGWWAEVQDSPILCALANLLILLVVLCGVAFGVGVGIMVIMRVNA